MKIECVQSAQQKKDFLKVNIHIHQHIKPYIQPLDKDIEDIFDVHKNPKLKKNCQAKRWILKDDANHWIGRIAAFTNPSYTNKETNFRVGGIGFFDCVDNQSAANLLFETAKNWLQEQGMEAMDGPINLNNRDKWWGLMVEGFEAEPIYGMPYNPPYYAALFENFGFKNYYNQYWYKMVVADPLPPKFAERANRFLQKPDYQVKHLSLDNLPKFAADFTTIYNAAWAQHGEKKEITTGQTLQLFSTMKPVIDPKTIWFAYYKEEPIGMFVNLPDVNEYFKHFKGKLTAWNKLRIGWMKYKKTCKRLTGLVFGVIPKYQSLGIDSFLIMACAGYVQKYTNYESYEMGWAGDWNPRMVNIYKNLGGKQSRRMVTYRYIFNDQAHPFRRHPIMDYQTSPS